MNFYKTIRILFIINCLCFHQLIFSEYNFKYSQDGYLIYRTCKDGNCSSLRPVTGEGVLNIYHNKGGKTIIDKLFGDKTGIILNSFVDNYTAVNRNYIETVINATEMSNLVRGLNNFAHNLPMCRSRGFALNSIATEPLAFSPAIAFNPNPRGRCAELDRNKVNLECGAIYVEFKGNEKEKICNSLKDSNEKNILYEGVCNDEHTSGFFPVNIEAADLENKSSFDKAMNLFKIQKNLKLIAKESTVQPICLTERPDDRIAKCLKLDKEQRDNLPHYHPCNTNWHLRLTGVKRWDGKKFSDENVKQRASDLYDDLVLKRRVPTLFIEKLKNSHRGTSQNIGLTDTGLLYIRKNGTSTIHEELNEAGRKDEEPPRIKRDILKIMKDGELGLREDFLTDDIKLSAINELPDNLKIDAIKRLEGKELKLAAIVDLNEDMQSLALNEFPELKNDIKLLSSFKKLSDDKKIEWFDRVEDSLKLVAMREIPQSLKSQAIESLSDDMKERYFKNPLDAKGLNLVLHAKNYIESDDGKANRELARDRSEGKIEILGIGLMDPLYGHGNHVAGTLASADNKQILSDNFLHIEGVSPDASVIPLRANRHPGIIKETRYLVEALKAILKHNQDLRNRVKDAFATNFSIDTDNYCGENHPKKLSNWGCWRDILKSKACKEKYTGVYTANNFKVSSYNGDNKDARCENIVKKSIDYYQHRIGTVNMALGTARHFLAASSEDYNDLKNTVDDLEKDGVVVVSAAGNYSGSFIVDGAQKRITKGKAAPCIFKSTLCIGGVAANLTPWDKGFKNQFVNFSLAADTIPIAHTNDDGRQNIIFTSGTTYATSVTTGMITNISSFHTDYMLDTKYPQGHKLSLIHTMIKAAKENDKDCTKLSIDQNNPSDNTCVFTPLNCDFKKIGGVDIKLEVMDKRKCQLAIAGDNYGEGVMTNFQKILLNPLPSAKEVADYRRENDIIYADKVKLSEDSDRALAYLDKNPSEKAFFNQESDKHQRHAKLALAVGNKDLGDTILKLKDNTEYVLGLPAKEKNRILALSPTEIDNYLSLDSKVKESLLAMDFGATKKLLAMDKEDKDYMLEKIKPEYWNAYLDMNDKEAYLVGTLTEKSRQAYFDKADDEKKLFLNNYASLQGRINTTAGAKIDGTIARTLEGSRTSIIPNVFIRPESIGGAIIKENEPEDKKGVTAKDYSSLMKTENIISSNLALEKIENEERDRFLKFLASIDKKYRLENYPLYVDLLQYLMEANPKLKDYLKSEKQVEYCTNEFRKSIKKIAEQL